jgi:hypothetical protein
MKVTYYGRVSTTKQAERDLSLPDQEARRLYEAGLCGEGGSG